MRPRTPVPQLLAIPALLATIVLSGCANAWGGNCRHILVLPVEVSTTPEDWTVATLEK